MTRRFFTCRLLCVLSVLIATSFSSARLAAESTWVSDTAGRATENRFPLVAESAAAPLRVDASDWPGVIRAARDLQADIERVTGISPALSVGTQAAKESPAVLIGTVGRSALIDDLAARGKIDVSAIRGRWEAFVSEVVTDPLPGISRALVIAGSDKRGTIYGIYDLSGQIGVSPWYWWADVPVTRRSGLHVLPGRREESGPAVKYRGIFLNDEAPALTGWVDEKFGGYNHRFYERVFELLLRLRANYLWPAMWDAAFNDDGPLNRQLADEYGIVMGTSHHEPMMRAHKEWQRYGRGPWNYATNAEVLREFWTSGIRRNRPYESIVTLGMRGDGDEPMSEEANVALLERIVGDQRAILAQHINPDLTQVPQLWALYKEVQEYYEKGMRVPDDVTLLWCDDNWGNIRRLPTPKERARPGGAGVYYHFDYVGGPRNYKWLNVTPITKIWEQMHLAWQHGADRIWIVNVGDLKPMEFPIEFFLTYAWDPECWPYERLEEYSQAWAAREFGTTHAPEIAALINGYTKLNRRRTPELLAPDTFSLIHYRESERVLAEWRALAVRAEKLEAALPPEARPAFLQLVLHPIQACANLNELLVTAGLNRLYATQGRASTNVLAARVRELFERDAALTRRWDAMLDGKWRHMMDQVHLGYTIWQQPVANIMPAVSEVHVSSGSRLALAVEGDAASRPGNYPVSAVAKLPPLSALAPNQTRWIELFNRGNAPVRYTVELREPWLQITPAAGKVGPDVRLEVSADWSAVPPGEHVARLVVRPDDGAPLQVDVPVSHPKHEGISGFVEVDRHVAIEAPHFTRAVTGGPIDWRVLPDFGGTLGAITAFPVTAPTQPLPLTPASPRLEYAVQLFSAGDIAIELHVAPVLPFTPGRGVRCAISIDDETPQIVDIAVHDGSPEWARAVSDSIHRVRTRHRVARPGPHVVKFWLVDPGVVLQRIILDAGGLRPSYLGPPESPRFKTR